ncbi:MAG: efflux RND transporter periplasmic adaptor subunit [Deltaproteobacteria bacterium]|nr:MAG: efflux RND transporter periplasmic adaptor subunit [Deltaproteobacteria bacterium]
MFTSRNFVTIALVVGVGALGWVGGSRFSGHGGGGDAVGAKAPHPSAQTADGHAEPAAGHGDAGEKEAHAGHGHGQSAESKEFCEEHRIPENRDVLCNPGLMTTLLPGEGVKMRLATPEAAARAGIVIAPAKQAGLAGGPALPARVTYNRGRLAEVMALAGGTVRRIAAEPGQTVGKGALLAEIASPGAALARGDYQAALGRLELAEANARREEELVAKGVSARMELEQARAEQQAARAAVEQLREQLAAFGSGPAGGGAFLALRSPLAGTVVARSAVAGQTLTPETPLFTVADLSSMWLEMQVGADQTTQIRPGAAVEAEVDGLPGQRFPGKIVQVGAGLNEHTRLLTAVAEIANPDGLLKDGMFGQAWLAAAVAAGERGGEPAAEKGDGHGHAEARTGRDDEHGHAGPAGEDARAAAVTVSVPAAAVQSIDGKAYVFVALEQDLFELRRVEAGPRRAGEIVVTAGLNPGEKVVASQGFALKSELLKSRLGASCADH